MPPLNPLIAVITAAALDQLIGDPHWCPHPVVVMGAAIQQLRRAVEQVAGDRRFLLRLGGAGITLLLVFGSGSVGWGIERIALLSGDLPSALGAVLLVIGLASTLAARSLGASVMAVLQAAPLDPAQSLDPARQRLSWIVGRDVSRLTLPDIHRAAAESASENAVDGVFAPLFWMLMGAGLWMHCSTWPGPLSLAFGFKAASTLDSMLGYRTGRLRWLGTAGARLDDLLTWIPCRLVMLTLPLISRPWKQLPQLIRAAERDGAKDPSPNSGRSEAIYAHCAGVQLGGRNRYGDRWVEKPLLAAGQPEATETAVRHILVLTLRLEIAWLLLAAVVNQLASGGVPIQLTWRQ